MLFPTIARVTFLKHKSDCLTPLLYVTYKIALEFYKWPFIVSPSLPHRHTHRSLDRYFSFTSLSISKSAPSAKDAPPPLHLTPKHVSRPRPSSAPWWGLWLPQAIRSSLLCATTALAAYFLKHLSHCAVIIGKHIPFSSTITGLLKWRV